ncbi:MAG TPA: hypothetical protein VF916_03540, partial [Ktedonobacterales bacterium]
LVRLPEFTLGVALGLLHLRWQEHPGSSLVRHLNTNTRAYDCAILACAMAIIGLLFLPLPAHYPVVALVMPVFATVIVLLAQGRGAIAALLATPTGVWLGEISYAIYILHAPLWAWLVWIGHAVLHLSPAAPLLLPVYLAAVLYAAGLCYQRLERPARAAIRARWGAWERQRQAASALAHAGTANTAR